MVQPTFNSPRGHSTDDKSLPGSPSCPGFHYVVLQMSSNLTYSAANPLLLSVHFFKRFYLFREKGKERDGKKHQSVACPVHPLRVRSPQPRHLPDRESNKRPFALQDDTQPHRIGQGSYPHTFKIYRFSFRNFIRIKLKPESCF